MLGHESFQHLSFDTGCGGRCRAVLHRFFKTAGVVNLGCVFHVRREIRPIPQMAPAAHHRQIDAGTTTLHLHRQDVHIAIRHVVHRLLMQHVGQRRHLIAQFGRLLELQLFSMRHHASLQRLHDLTRIATQKTLGVGHVLRIVRGRNMADARR